MMLGDPKYGVNPPAAASNLVAPMIAPSHLPIAADW